MFSTLIGGNHNNQRCSALSHGHGLKANCVSLASDLEFLALALEAVLGFGLEHETFQVIVSFGAYTVVIFDD